MTIVLQAIGNVTESLSLILLIPLFQFIGHEGNGTRLHIPSGIFANVIGPYIDVELWVILTFFVTLMVLVAGFNKFKAIYAAELFSSTINVVRTDLFKSIARAKWLTIARLRKADLNHALTGDIDRVQAAVTSLYSIVQSLIFFCLYFVLSTLISVKMTLFATVAGILVFMVQRPIRVFASRYGERLTKRRQAQYRTIADFLGGLKVAKSFNAEEKYISEFDTNLDDMRTDIIHFAKMNSNGNVIYQSLIAILLCIFIYTSYAAYHVEFSRIVILMVIFMRISPRIADIQSQFQTLLLNLSSFESMQRLKALCDAACEDNSAQLSAQVTFKGEIAFKKVSFSYGEARILKDISFKIPPGRITALSGQSGSGKSTIADLAMGLLIPETGEILLDGLPLTDQTRRAWRGQIAYVPQESYLLSTTLLQNMLLAAPEASTTEVREALRQARALAFIDALPHGLDTIVGDGGIALSGGERQRVALARALLKKPALLILDEVTSALDKENTDGIIETILALRNHMTILLITHNATVLESAGQVISIEGGMITDICHS
jgi:ATP-binding cassette subfamily C protein